MNDDDTGKPRPSVSLATIDRVADRHEREEMERLLAASEEQLDEELKEAGFAPDDAENVVNAALEAARAGAKTHVAPKVVSLAAARQRRGRGAGWLVLAAAAAAVVVLGGGAAAVVALRTPAPGPTSGPSIAPEPPRPPPEVLAKQDAEVLRRQAATECGAQAWPDCVGDLERAATLDPAGDVGAARRLHGKAVRGMRVAELEAKPGALSARSLLASERPRLAESLAPHAGQPLRVVCARGPEPESYCRDLAAVMTRAGWVVTREVAARNAGVARGVAIRVGAGADEATEDAGEALADGLERAGVRTAGPDDAPGDAPGVTLTVGEQ